jgi:hypothetical protein
MPKISSFFLSFFFFKKKKIIIIHPHGCGSLDPRLVRTTYLVGSSDLWPDMVVGHETLMIFIFYFFNRKFWALILTKNW